MTRRGALLRLGGLVATVAALGLLLALVAPLSRSDLEGFVEPFGVLGPVVFVVVGAVLALALVPGPLLSAASGAVFGTWLGFGVSLASSVLTSVLGLLLARRAGREPVEVLSGPRTAAFSALAVRRGLLVVVLQRWVPGLPDAPFSYVFGLLGLVVGQVALGTLLGSAPRAFAYTALGDAAVTGDGRLAVVALVVGVAVSVAGLVAGAVVVRRHRAG